MTNASGKALNLLLLVAIAAAVTFWILQFSSPGSVDEVVVAVPTADRAARTQVMDIAPIARLFGSGEMAMPSSNIAVVGVIDQGGRNKGVALLSVDNRPAMAFRAGEPVSGDLTLKQVKENGVIVESNGMTREILLPARQPPFGIEPAQ